MAQIGNNNAAKGTRWRTAIEHAIESWPDAYNGGSNDLMKGINAAAHNFVAKMMQDGDIQFFKEFGDRLDGKAKQQVEVGGNGNPLAIERIERVIVDPKA
jgi:hypothetical protein